VATTNDSHDLNTGQWEEGRPGQCRLKRIGCVAEMDAVPELEDYIRTAPVLHAVRLEGGGGHQHKQLIVLDGGIGVVAKLAEGTPTAPMQVRCEIAASLLARELHWPDLVPLTAMRAVRSIFSDIDVAASVQVVWPLFTTAGELHLTETDCRDHDQWRVALFDAMANNSDRSVTNWGCVKQLDGHAKLIDNGNAFAEGAPAVGPFVALRRGQTVPAEHLEHVQSFVDQRRRTALGRVLTESAVQHVFDRAQAICEANAINA
jgi:hypothetical protein